MSNIRYAMRLQARHAARLDACWPAVRVESVDVIVRPEGERARALIQLGGLTPADVQVEVMSTDPADATHSPPGDERRMCCYQSYDNGAFVFDAALPPHDPTRPHEWVIHVHPSEPLHEPLVQYRFLSGSDRGDPSWAAFL